MDARITMKEYRKKVVDNKIMISQVFDKDIPRYINQNSENQCFQLKSKDIDLL